MSVESSSPGAKLSASVSVRYAAMLVRLKARGVATRQTDQRHSRQAGQGMTEYIIIVALVAVYQYLGQVLRAQTAAVAKELAGEDGTQQSRAAQSAAESAASQAAARSLKDFTGNAEGAAR